MSWHTVLEFNLRGSDMCIWERNFKPYIPSELIEGLNPGKYRIRYIDGAIRTYNKHRFRDLLPDHIIIHNNPDFPSSYYIKELSGTYYKESVNTWSLYTSKQPEVLSSYTKNSVITKEDDLYYVQSVKDSTISTVFTKDKIYGMIDVSGILSTYALFESDFEFKWNKYYTINTNLEGFQDKNLLYLPELKYNVFQCVYGTLPGFTIYGGDDIDLAIQMSKGTLIPEEFYNIIKDTVIPLEFTLEKKSSISFWYTDDCAPCIEGGMTYILEKYVEDSDIVVNTLGVLSYNINTLESEIPEYYELPVVSTFLDQYHVQKNNIDIENCFNYIYKLSGYNSLTYNNNITGYYTNYPYLELDKSKYLPDIFWRLTKKSEKVDFDLIKSVSNEYVPLFPGIYTLIPSNNLYLTGKFIFQNGDEVLLETEITEKIKEYSFEVTYTQLINFRTTCYLYAGKFTNKELLNFLSESFDQYSYDPSKINSLLSSASLSTTTTSGLLKQDYNTSLSSINLYHIKEYYLYILDNTAETSLIEIITDISFNELTTKLSLIKSRSLIGPFYNKEDAIKETKKYCLINNKKYEQISEFVFLIENNEE